MIDATIAPSKARDKFLILPEGDEFARGPMPEVHIVVPTKARWMNVLVKQFLPPGAFKLLVEPHEEALYREHNPDIPADCIVVHPEEVWPYCLKMQWAYENFGSIFSLDDDVNFMVHLEHADREPTHGLDPEATYEAIMRTAADAWGAGAFLFGYSTSGAVINYRDHQPFRRVGFVTAEACGLFEGSKVAWNPTVKGSADFWVSLVNAFHHRHCWLDMRYCPDEHGGSTTFAGAGGVASVRNNEVEKQDWLLLRRYFGDAVWRKEAVAGGKRLKGAKHEYHHSMSIPWAGW